MYYLFLSALGIALWHSAFTQTAYPLIGARTNGAAYTSACMEDGSAILNNVAGIATIKDATVGFGYDAMPSFHAFNRFAAFIAIPVKIGVVGGGIFHFGDDLFNEQSISLGYANKFGLASLGGRVQFMQTQIDGLGKKSLASFSAGGIAELAPWLKVGAHVINISQPKITEYEKIPTILFVGIALKASGKIIVMAEVEKDMDYDPCIKGGLEYTIHKKFVLRTGVNVNPEKGFFGFGFTPKNYLIDYAFTYQPSLGARHQVAFGYVLSKKK